MNLLCNWLLHIELSNSTVGHLLGALDREFRKYNPKRPYEFDPAGIIQDTVSLQIFRNELMEFLGMNDLPTVWVEDIFAWADLLRFYGEEVRDTPLKLSGERRYNGVRAG